jgi:hypothetical protein
LVVYLGPKRDRRWFERIGARQCEVYEESATLRNSIDSVSIFLVLSNLSQT